MVTCIVRIVEGHGEVQAVPALIRRIATEIGRGFDVRVERPIRQPRNKLARPDEIERAVDLAARRAGQDGAVLVLIDSDGEPPCTLGPTLLQRAQAVRPAMPIGLVLAHQEYEAWFLASAESLRGVHGLPSTLEPPVDPEGIRGAKEWLIRHMPKGVTYSETQDQAAFTARFDLSLARRAGSFDKCYREIAKLLTSVAQ